MKRLVRFLSPLLIACLVAASITPAFASGADSVPLIGTADALQATSASHHRDQIRQLLTREDVQQQLLARGVSPADVNDRVAALSDEEAHQMAEQLDNLPAGASSVLGVLFGVFVILLVTDILGLTDVFPFTR
ncbi:MAG: PA2779 family protein [Halomonas sp.]|uniref:PA2779 family protein n=1 Tax=Halomonas sp. TaxID=1486246 RepID=UPI003F8EB6C5